VVTCADAQNGNPVIHFFGTGEQHLYAASVRFVFDQKRRNMLRGIEADMVPLQSNR